MTKSDLYKVAKSLNISGRSGMNKAALVDAIAHHYCDDNSESESPDSENVNDSTLLRDALVSSMTDFAIMRRRLPECTAGPQGPQLINTPTSPDGKVITCATLLAVVGSVQGIASLDAFPATGGIEKLSNSGEFSRDYSPHGRLVEPCYPLDSDPTPVVFDALVNAGDLLAGGYTFGMAETRFRQSSDAALRRLAKSDAIPPVWHGEATTVGSIGTNRMASIREMLLDSLAPYGPGDYRIEDPTVTLENIQQAMCDPKLVVIGKSPKARLAAAYKAAQAATAEQLKSGEISSEIRMFQNVEYAPDTLVLEREAVIEDLAAKNDLEDRNDLDFKDFRGWMAAWDKTDFEQAREAMKAFRMVVVNKQRDYFTRILNHIMGGKVSKVAKAFRFPNGTFHTDMKNAKDSDGESRLSSDQRVILDATAAIKVGRKVSEAQAAIYDSAIANATWEAWMAGLGADTDFDPTDPDAPEDNPWDNNGSTPTKAAPPKGAAPVKPLRRAASERSAVAVALCTLDKNSAMWFAINQANADSDTELLDWYLSPVAGQPAALEPPVCDSAEEYAYVSEQYKPETNVSTTPPADAEDTVPTFTEGSTVKHPVFGAGRVLMTKEGKVKVQFSDETRKLSADPTFWQ